MKKFLSYGFILLTLAACSKLPVLDYTGTIELQGIDATVSGGIQTKAAALDADNYVGRSAFVNNDQMVITTIKRTVSPIDGFSYSGIVYNHEVEAGQKSGGWNRDATKGRTVASENAPERIYWSDAANDHTYIGYSVPQGSFDWEVKQAYTASSSSTLLDVYYGSIGDPAAVGYIDHTDSTKIVSDDLLLTYDDAKVAETGGSVAKLYFHHALANVRVIVNIQGFSASTDAADSWSVVTDMVLKQMLTLYKWKQQSYAAEALEATYDSDNVTALYGSEVSFDQKKDLHLWIPRPEGTGTGVGKQFTFYGLAVPVTLPAGSLKFQFTVKYPDPMNPWSDADKTIPNLKKHTYTATMASDIEFRAGHCTTINVSLNHNNEEITIGAEYMDWQYVETPDEGELKKGDNFLTTTDRSSVTIASDAAATADDATWLYNAGTAEAQSIKDIYGNDGTEAAPYTISTANQLLSFAYEVKNGRKFNGQYVKLDADIIMQKKASKSNPEVTWIGIGDATNFFYGTFNGCGRNISFLKGAPLFYKLGPYSVVDKVNMSNTIEIDGLGAIANTNDRGLICSCSIDGDVYGVNATGTYCGSIVGINEMGMIVGCRYVGTVNSAQSIVGGIVGYNSGSIIASYHSGSVISSAPNADIHAAIGKYPTDKNSYAISSYFNNNYNSSTTRPLTPGKTAFGVNTDNMQRESFVNSTNDMISGTVPSESDWTKNHYSLNVALQKFVDELSQVQIGSNGWGTFLTLTLSEAGKQKFLEHFATEGTVEGKVVWTLRDDHKFTFIPADYPRVK